MSGCWSIRKSVVKCAGKVGRHYWYFCCVVLLLCCISPQAQGAPAFGDLFSVRQPDGTYLEVRIWGDEFYGVTETPDGYTLIRDPKTMFLCYADLSKDGNDLVSTGVRVDEARPADLGLQQHIRINADAAHAKALDARAAFEEYTRSVLGGRTVARGPSIGNVVGITLIIEFPDVAGTIASAEVSNYCNQVGYTGFGNNGSVRDYFFDVSNGLLTYTNFVPTAYFTAANNRSYYTDPAIPYGTRARELILEALNDMETNGFDFSLYDADSDGVIDALNCFYAGPCVNNWAEGLWPHAWTISFSADGVSTGSYQITNMGNSLILATFCHENGHMLMGWPDLYDYGYDSAGVGRFCIMCYSTSSTNPQEPCAYLKYVAGWSTTTVLSVAVPQMGLTVPVGGNTFYKIEHPMHTYEYYLIENRQKTGRDAGIPDAGLAIWHVDTTGSNDNQQMTPTLHYEATLVQADGNWDLENNVNTGDAFDLWAAPTYTDCTPDTNPDTDWWDGYASGSFITAISASGPTMTFNWGLTPGPPVDVVFILDVTGSTGGLLPGWQAQMPGIINQIESRRPNSRYGLASHVDYPFSPYGDPGPPPEYAYRVETPLVSFAQVATNFIPVLNALNNLWGADDPESQLEAIYQALTGAGRDLSLPPDGDYVDLGEIAPSNMGYSWNTTVLIHFTWPAMFHNYPNEEPNYPCPGCASAADWDDVVATITGSPNPVVYFGLVTGPLARGMVSPQTGKPYYPSRETDPITALAELTGGAVFDVGGDLSGLPDAIDDALDVLDSHDIPAVSEWGLLVLGLLLLTGAKVYFGRQRMRTTAA